MTDMQTMDPSLLNGTKQRAEHSSATSSPTRPVSKGEENDAGYDSDATPTAEEWNTMRRYGSFITHDDDEKEHTFHINDIIYVMPQGKNPEEPIGRGDLWLAQIKSIRAYDSRSVWIRAKWFFHPRELPKKVKGASAKAKEFGELERVTSNHADFIPTSTCCGLASVISYDEQDFEQQDIGPDAFYYRCDYDCHKQILSRQAQPCSICKKFYNPDTDIMHFCPRPNCRKAWHTECLGKKNWYIKSDENFLQRMESIQAPSTADTKPVPKKKARTKAVPPRNKPDPYANIPAGLLAVARQPIARGGYDLGVVGNVRSVTRARRMVQDALAGVSDIPDDWAETLGTVFDASLLGPSDEVKRKAKALSYQCPSCGEPI